MTELRCTYRLQLGPGLGFAEARELVPYLRDLGVSHLYLPPSFQARTGSTHGYDVVDPTRVSDELGVVVEGASAKSAAMREGAAGCRGNSVCASTALGSRRSRSRDYHRPR